MTSHPVALASVGLAPRILRRPLDLASSALRTAATSTRSLQIRKKGHSAFGDRTGQRLDRSGPQPEAGRLGVGLLVVLILRNGEPGQLYCTVDAIRIDEQLLHKTLAEENLRVPDMPSLEEGV